jgi:hypothetical protein
MVVHAPSHIVIVYRRHRIPFFLFSLESAMSHHFLFRDVALWRWSTV